MGIVAQHTKEKREQQYVDKIYQEIIPYLAPGLREIIANLPEDTINELEEIRLRVQAPVLLRTRTKDIIFNNAGIITEDINHAYICTNENLQKTVLLLSNSSFYALEEELQKGYLTLPGGHRVGFVGRGVLDKGHIKTLKQISSINIRIARFISGAADEVMKYLIDDHNFRHTLIVSPPRCGKTTVLRDIVAHLSNGFPQFPAVDVGVVDERSEIAGCKNGIPQMPVGYRTDILDACPKAEGMMMLVRSMAPHVIATDEIGSQEDIMAIQEVINAGIKLLATAHGANLEELLKRPVLSQIIKEKVFERYIILSRQKGPGTIEGIYNRDLRLIVRS